MNRALRDVNLDAVVHVDVHVDEDEDADVDVGVDVDAYVDIDVQVIAREGPDNKTKQHQPQLDKQEQTT